MGLADHLQTYLPNDDARLRLTPAAVIEVVVRNLVAGHRPVYALGEWAEPYDPAVLGLGAGDAAMLNDDRVGRTLDRLFDADPVVVEHCGVARSEPEHRWVVGLRPLTERVCLLYTSPSPRDGLLSRMPSS